MPNQLGDQIRTLLKQRGMKAFELGDEIGLSATSISKIMNGASRPRQNTFTRMCQALCETKDEEQKLVAAYAGTEFLEEEEQAPYGHQRRDAEQEILRLRAEQFLERKTQAILFKRSVARELDQAGIPYQQDYCDGPYSTDFLIEHEGKRIALECKANVERDIEKTIAQAELIGDKLNCQVFVVAPYIHNIASIDGVKLYSLGELTKHI